MKKSILYSVILTTALCSSCKGDYDDWAAPQGYGAEEAQNVNVTVASPGAINIADVTGDSLSLFTPTVDAPAGMNVTSYMLSLTPNDSDEITTVKTINADNNGRVAKADLVKAVTELYGKRPTERKMKTIVTAYLKQNAQAFYANSNEIETGVTLATPVIEEKYYLAGDMLDAGTATELTHSSTDVYEDPTFTITFKTTADNQKWNIVPKSNYDAGNVLISGNYGPSDAADAEAMSGTLVKEGAQSGIIKTAGKYIMTINLNDYSYSIAVAPSELYMTGSNYGWITWNKLTPVWGADGEYWAIFYLHTDEQFKFAPQAGWGGDFGGQATINDVAGAGIVADGTNLKVTNAGWYLLDVVNNGVQTVNIYAPDVYLIGNTAGEWNIADSHKFTVPATDNGDFVSPEFAASDEVRICVNFGGYDWWKTEFIVLDGKINYRGNGNDQSRVVVTAGQKAYLNFTTGEGSFK